MEEKLPPDVMQNAGESGRGTRAAKTRARKALAATVAAITEPASKRAKRENVTGGEKRGKKNKRKEVADLDFEPIKEESDGEKKITPKKRIRKPRPKDTPAQKTARTARRKRFLESLTPEERQKRLETKRLKYHAKKEVTALERKLRIAQETPEERERRLQMGAAKSRKHRQKVRMSRMTLEQRERYNAEQRISNKNRSEQETPEQRERRLRKMYLCRARGKRVEELQQETGLTEEEALEELKISNPELFPRPKTLQLCESQPLRIVNVCGAGESPLAQPLKLESGSLKAPTLEGTPHPTSLTESESTLCSYCGKKFFLAASVRAHIKAVHCPEGMLTTGIFCEHCEMSFSHQSALDAHFESKHFGHLMEAICELCGDYFSSPILLHQHKLQRHKDTNAARLPSSKHEICRYCYRQIFQMSMISHVKIEHPERFEEFYKVRRRRPQICMLCKETFESQAKLNDHNRRFHPELIVKRHKDRRLRCNVCGWRYWFAQDLAEHIAKWHDQPNAAVVTSDSAEKIHEDAEMDSVILEAISETQQVDTDLAGVNFPGTSKTSSECDPAGKKQKGTGRRLGRVKMEVFLKAEQVHHYYSDPDNEAFTLMSFNDNEQEQSIAQEPNPLLSSSKKTTNQKRVKEKPAPAKTTRSSTRRAAAAAAKKRNSEIIVSSLLKGDIPHEDSNSSWNPPASPACFGGDDNFDEDYQNDDNEEIQVIPPATFPESSGNNSQSNVTSGGRGSCDVAKKPRQGKSRQLTCDICKKGCFENSTKLRFHKERVHGGLKIGCPFSTCSWETNHSINLAKHYYNAHILQNITEENPIVRAANFYTRTTMNSSSEKPVRGKKTTGPKICSHCGETFPVRRLLRCHIREFHPPQTKEKREKGGSGEKFQCEDCGKVFSKKFKLKHHIKAQHLGEEVLCDLCPKSYKTARSVYRHKVQCHGMDPSLIPNVKRSQPCPFCQEEVSSIMKHVEMEHQEFFKEFKTLRSKINYRNKHPLPVKQECDKKQQLQEVDNFCAICNKQLVGSSKTVRLEHDLLLHPELIIGNQEDNRLTCVSCGMKFWIKQELAHHIVTSHAMLAGVHGKRFNLDPQPCRFCSADLGDDIRILKVHILHEHVAELLEYFNQVVATGEATSGRGPSYDKAFCKYCPRQTQTNSNMATHMRDDHPTKPSDDFIARMVKSKITTSEDSEKSRGVVRAYVKRPRKKKFDPTKILDKFPEVKRRAIIIILEKVKIIK